MAARDAARSAETVYLSVTSLAQRSGGRCLEQLRAGGRSEVLGGPFVPREFAAACRMGSGPCPRT